MLVAAAGRIVCLSVAQLFVENRQQRPQLKKEKDKAARLLHLLLPTLHARLSGTNNYLDTAAC